MNKYYFSIMSVIALFFLGFNSCKEKQKSDDIIVAKYVPEKIGAPIKLPTDERTTQVEWQGKTYTVFLTRQASDSLPMLKDEKGQQYVDNQIRLIIKRNDNSLFLKKTFTKESFVSYLESDFRQKGILENIAFLQVDEQRLKFGVVISRPENDDLFIPLDMWIDRMGGMVIKPGTLFDDIDNNNEEEEGV